MSPSDPRASELAALEKRFGAPAIFAARLPMLAPEWDLLLNSMRDGRWEDATIFIPRDEGFVVIVKHVYPPGIARIPSGGVGPREDIEAAARREALEETGLEVEPVRYLLRADAEFRLGAESRRWRSHAFLARATGGSLAPRDTREIAEVLVRSQSDIEQGFHPRMLATGVGGFRYRVLLERACFAEMVRRGRPPR